GGILGTVAVLGIGAFAWYYYKKRSALGSDQS
ncbi:hypothetical protein NFI96_025147, partial [Prochilodus magdalenae]